MMEETMDHVPYVDMIRRHLQTAYLLNDEKTEQMLPALLAVLNSHMTTLEEVHAEGDLEKLGRAGHAVKGALLNMGLPDLADQALRIEQHGKSGNTEIDYRSLIVELKAVVKTITVT